MKHLILGGGGFIGSHLAARLHARGDSVTCIDLEFPSFREGLLPATGIEQWEMDLRDAPDFRGALYVAKPDMVWQLAADMGGVEYFHSSHDWSAAADNGRINHNVMTELAKLRIPPRVLFTSTACALATEKQTHCYRETGMLDPDSPPDMQVPWENGLWPLCEKDLYWGTPDQLYGQEKRNSAIMWSRSSMDARVVFLHTVYGPYQEHSGIKMKFPSAVVQKARRARGTGRMELLGDGRQVRTYMYIDDCVDRLLAVGHAKGNVGPVNIGGTMPYTVDEVARIALDAAGVQAYGDVRTVTMKKRASLIHIDGPTGVEARCADMTKFNAAFPQFSPGIWARDATLREGLLRFIQWLDAEFIPCT